MKTLFFENEKTKGRIMIRLYADKITATPVGPGKLVNQFEKPLTLRLPDSDIPYSDNCILSERNIRAL